MSPAQRRQQILDRALAIVRDEGLGAVSMKRIAREVAISEALAFKYFSTRAELLAALTRQELAAMAEYQEREIAQGESARSRIAHSTRAYFQQIEERGSVLHALLASSEVRILLRGENQARRARRGGEVGRAFAARYGVKPDLALAAVNTMTAATRRAGRWIALKKVTRQEVEPIVITMVEAVNRALVRP